MNVRVSLSPAPLAPSAALEPVPAVLIRRAAVSLHHAIDGDLRLGRQLHGSSVSLVVVVLGMTTPRRGSHRSRGVHKDWIGVEPDDTRPQRARSGGAVRTSHLAAPSRWAI